MLADIHLAVLADIHLAVLADIHLAVLAVLAGHRASSVLQCSRGGRAGLALAVLVRVRAVRIFSKFFVSASH